jgi:hypothetical protein
MISVSGSSDHGLEDGNAEEADVYASLNLIVSRQSTRSDEPQYSVGALRK